MPAVSTALGVSPTARRRRPKRVRYTTQATSGTIVAAVGDAGEAVHHGEKDRERAAGGEAEPGGAGDRGGRGGGECGAKRLALEADVDHARALGEQPCERREHQRRREADGRIREQERLEEKLVHQAT